MTIMGEPSMTNGQKKIITKGHGCCLGVRDKNFPFQIVPFGLGCDNNVRYYLKGWVVLKGHLGRIAAVATSPNFMNCSVFLAT